MTERPAPREPGLYPSLSNADYHADPSLSASGMKLILEAPAIYKHERENPTHRNTYDFGSVWHKLVLDDASEDFVVIMKTNREGARVEAGDDKTVSAQEHIKEIRAAGKTPIFAKQLAVVQQMVKAFNAHPKVAEYLDLKRGAIETSAFWTDPETGVPLRVRFDYLPDGTADRFTIVDVKTSTTAEPYAWLRKAPDYGYHLQDSMYRRAVRDLGLHPRPDFLFLVQAKTAPYLVTPIRLAAHSQAVGDHLTRQAIRTFARCLETDTWPGYTDDIVHENLPGWYLNQFEGVA